MERNAIQLQAAAAAAAVDSVPFVTTTSGRVAADSTSASAADVPCWPCSDDAYVWSSIE